MDQVVLKEFWPAIVVCARLIGMFTWMPGLGETKVPFRYRMTLSISLAILFSAYLPRINFPSNIIHQGVYILKEGVIGMFFGVLLKVIFQALETGGAIISQMTGLSNVMTQSAISPEQNSIFSGFLTLAGMTLIFTADMHHYLIKGAYASFTIIPVNDFFHMQDKALIITEIVAQSFAVAVQFATPFIVFGLLLYLGMGVANKLIPQIQVYFVSLPLQIVVGFLIMIFSIAGILRAFQDYFYQAWTGIMG